MPPLLLPAPRFRACVRCHITSRFVPIDEYAETLDLRKPIYFVDHGYDEDGEPYWSMCDLCHAEWAAEHTLRRPDISIHFGQPSWEEGEPFFGFANVPMVCFTDASNAEYRAGTQGKRELWLYFRNRAEWRSAWQIARIFRRYGYWPKDRYGSVLDFLPAYRPLGASFLSINIERLNRFRAPNGPMVAWCDGCGEQAVLLPRGKSQWVNCERCNACKLPRAHRRRRRKGGRL